MRIGQGYDVHKLVKGRKLILGGVQVNHEYGLLGHSDADVLLHAIMDSILGATALGDIGKHFPDNDMKYKNANSLDLLKQTNDIIRKANFKIINIDSTIIAQQPKLQPYINKMRENIANVCNLNINQVSVKATTEEGLGFTGKKEGIAATAVTLVENN